MYASDNERRYDVALSFANEDRAFVDRVAKYLKARKIRVFYDRDEQINFWGKDIKPTLDSVFRIRSYVVVLFISKHYANKMWTSLERQSAFARANLERREFILPARFDDTELEDLRPTVGYVDLRTETPESFALKISQKLEQLRESLHTASGNSPVMKPSWLRQKFDRWLPFLHVPLTRKLRLFNEPPESQVLSEFLRNQSGDIREEIKLKAYIDPPIKDASEKAGIFQSRRTGFINQFIKEILGLSHGGDAHNAQVSVLSRKSKFVRDMVKRVLTAQEPLVLLGDPGMGKSITLLQAAMLMSERESTRIFPRVCLFVPLGGFRIGDNKRSAVWDYVIDSTPAELRPYLEDLAEGKRLIILFDGMDEMSRAHYNAYTTALSDFAKEQKDRIKTLFSCRITDFTPAFRHNRLVVLPFTEDRISQFLGLQSIIKFPIKIGGQWLSRSALAKKITEGELPVQATNPFVLWLLCKYILNTNKWPTSRVELLDHYNRSNYEEKMSTVVGGEHSTQTMESAFLVWGKLAFEVTNRNMGTEFPLSEVDKLLGPDELIRLNDGVRCGVFSQDKAATLIRFKHHRFQEFFTAYYLRNSKQVVYLLWLDKLDSPRWQETMFNLVLMGGGDEALLALTESFEQDVAKLAELDAPVAEVAKSDDEPQPVLPEVDEAEKRATITNIETLLADRVELASRILHQTQHQPNEIRSTLLPAFERAVDWLSDHGNPITQVKLLLAARIVPEIEIWHVINKAIDRKVNWVSQQAHIIALATNRKRKVSEHAEGNSLGKLSNDLLLNFASGQFLNRLGYYLRIAASGEVGLKFVLAAGLLIYLTTFATSYGLVVTARQVIVPAFSRTEVWAQESLQTGIDFWERQDFEKVKQGAAEPDVEGSVNTREWLRSYFEESQSRFQAVIASAGQTLSSWWFLGVVHAVMLLSLFYALKTSPGYSVLAFQGAGYLCLLLTLTLWTLWLGGFFNTILLIYFLFLFIAAGSLIAWVATSLVELLGLALFSVITLFLTRQPFTRATLRSLPLQSFWDSGSRNSVQQIKSFLKIAFWPFLLIPISIGVEVDWPLVGQRLAQLPDKLPSIPLGIKISLNVLVFTFICVVVLRQMPRLISWIEQRRKKVTTSSVLDTLGGCFALLLMGVACSGVAALSKVNWQSVGAYAVQTFGLFPSLRTAVNVSFSVIAYAIVAGCLVTLVVLVVNRLRNVERTLEGLLVWVACCLTAAILVLIIWGVSKIDFSGIQPLIVATFSLFPYFPPVVNGLLSLAFYLEVIGCLVALGTALRKRDEGLQHPLKVLGTWSTVAFFVAAVPFLVWGVLLLIAKLGLGFYSAAVTGQLGPIFVVVLIIGCIISLFILTSQMLEGTPLDMRYALRRPANPIDEWKQFQHLSPKRQAMLITRASESNRSDEDFLKLLQSVEKSVAEEPASSVYWETRGKMEAIALQKRMG